MSSNISNLWHIHLSELIFFWLYPIFQFFSSFFGTCRILASKSKQDTYRAMGMYKNAYTRSFRYNLFSLVNSSLNSQYHKNTRKAVPAVKSIGKHIYECWKKNKHKSMPTFSAVSSFLFFPTIPFYFLYTTISVTPKLPLIYYSFQILPIPVASPMATLQLSFLRRSFSILSS